MKAIGIVRRIDGLGRVVIPKEVRRTLGIRSGDALAVFVTGEGDLVLRKYSPIAELSEFAQEYTASLHEATGQTALIADRDNVIAVAGGSRRALLGRPLAPLVLRAMQERKVVGPRNDAESDLFGLGSFVIAPIVAESEPVGAVVLGTATGERPVGEVERVVALTAARFLGRQMEQ